MSIIIYLSKAWSDEVNAPRFRITPTGLTRLVGRVNEVIVGGRKGRKLVRVSLEQLQRLEELINALPARQRDSLGGDFYHRPHPSDINRRKSPIQFVNLPSVLTLEDRRTPPEESPLNVDLPQVNEQSTLDELIDFLGGYRVIQPNEVLHLIFVSGREIYYMLNENNLARIRKSLERANQTGTWEYNDFELDEMQTQLVSFTIEPNPNILYASMMKRREATRGGFFSLCFTAEACEKEYLSSFIEWCSKTFQISTYKNIIKASDDDSRNTVCLVHAIITSLNGALTSQERASLKEAAGRIVCELDILQTISIIHIAKILEICNLTESLKVEVYDPSTDHRRVYGSVTAKRVANISVISCKGIPHYYANFAFGESEPVIYRSALECATGYDGSIGYFGLDKPNRLGFLNDVRDKRPIPNARALMDWFVERGELSGLLRPMTAEENAKRLDYTSAVGQLDKNLPSDLATLQEDFIKDDGKPQEDIIVSSANVDKFVFDFETRTLATNGFQLPYMVALRCFSDGEGDTTLFEGKACVSEMSKWLCDRYAYRKDANGRFGEECFTEKQNKAREYVEKKTGKPMLPAYKKVIGFAHNSKFDINVCAEKMKLAGWSIPCFLNNGGRPVSFTFCNEDLRLKIEIRDSYRIIGMAVRDIPDAFFKDDVSLWTKYNKKEIMLHEAVVDEFFNDDWLLSEKVEVSELRRITKAWNAKPENQAEPFNMNEWEEAFRLFTTDNGSIINFRQYVAHYCKRDVDITIEGIKAFDKIIIRLNDQLREVKGDTSNLLALPSTSFSLSGLADRFYQSQGMYDGVTAQKGALLKYMRAFVVGGRTTSGMFSKKGDYTESGGYECLDANSLYPSSMYELGSFPTGLCQRIPNSSIGISGDKFINKAQRSKCQAYFITCRVRTDAHERAIPRQDLSLGVYPRRKWITSVSTGDVEDDDSIETESQSIQWVNDLRDIPTIYFSNISFADYCETTGVSPDCFEILDGVYYQEREEEDLKIMRKCIDAIYSERQRAIEAGNIGMDITSKLMMNSGYGRLLLKMMQEDTKVIEGKSNALRYMYANPSTVLSMEKITMEEDDEAATYCILKRKPMMTCSGRYACGALVLDQSRAMMNKVVVACADAGVVIHYTDTDSITIPRNGVDKISETYEKRYGTTLLAATGLCKFSTDLKIKGLPKGTKVWSERFIYLGRKSYLHVLRSDRGDTGYKVSLKGITKAAIALACSVNKWTMEQLFETLLGETPVTFDLSAGGKCQFVSGGSRANYTLAIYKKKQITRTLVF